MGNYTNSKQIFTSAVSKGNNPLAPELVLNHDIYNQTVHDFVPFELAKLKQLGYRAVTVGECLGDSPEYWYRNASTGGAITASTASSPKSSSSSTPVPGTPGKMTTGSAIIKGMSSDASGYLKLLHDWTPVFGLALIALFAVSL
jgi:hypothetical protein